MAVQLSTKAEKAVYLGQASPASGMSISSRNCRQLDSWLEKIVDEKLLYRVAGPPMLVEDKVL